MSTSTVLEETEKKASVESTDKPSKVTPSSETSTSSTSTPTSMSLQTSIASLVASQSNGVSTVSTVSEAQSSLSEPTTITENLFPQSNLRPPVNGQSEMSQTNSTPLTTDMALDILSLENYKNDLFPDSSQLAQAERSTAPVQPQTPQTPTQPIREYHAPWIVTISMFWNDLPAIMMNNQPFVRLVDIHKQILPAKDTGILKKRCQLMGIEVENCNEMQRYFLVQYGKAFNSKSTLIISQDNAKELIGYYVNPQPKASRLDDQKSIIDHRREQLRRIALARRAAMRTQRTSEKKDDPREIKEVDKIPVSQQSPLPW